jgi:two-component system, OmpR family, response regulator VanR
VSQKTVLLVDDEQGFLEPLADALEYEGHRVLKATTAEDALRILDNERIHLVTVDIMMPPGPSIEGDILSHETGILLCETIRNEYPRVHVFCLSVVSDRDTIRRIESFGVKFLRKGETPLRTVLNMIGSKLTGVAYSTERHPKRGGL